MVFAWSLRPDDTAERGVSPTQDELRCGTTACQVAVTTDVGRDTVAVLVGQGSGRISTNGASGRNIFELTIAEQGATITDGSLECVDAEVAVCLVRGPGPAEVLGEVLVRRSGAWSRAQVPYVAGGGYLGLHDVDADGVADVVAVQRACAPGVDCTRRFAQVFSLVGPKPELGCTQVVADQTQLPGWPTVQPTPTQLRPCGE
ncbi:hypothetical protein [Saccharothrix sp.]|uniref:hypothetical protein n=1 Tax=Saccharothrix sp. TaxID=1873460 RepID=UPI0028125E48|nr:hypothetical protein [Saccharothrix sp.]